MGSAQKAQAVDILLIGGGIVGVATAWQLKQRFPDAGVMLVEKEPQLARHQTGRNSGVIHAGVYYAPGSLKADFCRRGATWTLRFCREQGLPVEQCGKLLVATDALELERMALLEQRCQRNGIATERLTRTELRQREPNIEGLGALRVAATGITDYRQVTQRLAVQFRRLGGLLRTGSAVCAMRERSDAVHIALGAERLSARYVIVCGGLMADRLARMLHIPIEFRIVPFRGEYYRLPARLNHLVRHLIYPIPDPALPFLGVHLTRMIDGSLTVGPNAVLGFKREGYGRLNLDPRDTLEMLAFGGARQALRANLRAGLSEMRDSLWRPGYLRRVRKYCPSLTLSDLQPHPTGIRAQAVMHDGTLIHDFLFAASPRSLHVCNAPSPAATSAMPIAAYLCQKAIETFGL